LGKLHFLNWSVSVFLWLASSCIAADAPVAVIENLNEPFDLSPYIEYIEDSDRSITYEQLQAGVFEDKWQLNTDRYFVGRNAQSRYWFRFTVRYAEDVSALRPLLYLPNKPGNLLELNLWIPNATAPVVGNVLQPIHSGYFHPSPQADIPVLRYSFILPVERTVYSVIGWVDNCGIIPAILPFSLLTEAQLKATNNQTQDIQTAFYAIMFALLLYNTCLFISLKKPMYGVYLLFLSSAIFICSTMDGEIKLILDIGSERLYYLISLAGLLLGLFYITFISVTLDKFQFSELLQKVFRYLFWLGVVVTLYGAFSFSYQQVAKITQFYSVPVMIFALLSIITALRRKIFIAKYLLLAEISTLFGATIFFLLLYGFVPVNLFTLWSFELGFLGESLLLSLALAAHTRFSQLQAINNLQKFEKLYEGSIKGRFQFNLPKNSLRCNNAMAHIFGYQNKEALIAASDGNLTPRGIWKSRELWEPLTRRGYITGLELPLVSTATQQEVWVSTTLQVLERDPEGKPTVLEGTMLNITEKKLKEQADKDRLFIQSQSQARSQFFASMSHELRTPLTAILGYSEAILSDTVEPNFIQNAITRIQHSGKHLLQIINDLLDLSKVEEQRLEVECRQVRLAPLIEEVKNTLDILVENKGLQLNIIYQYPLPTIFSSDATRIKQILINLCGNAIKFTEAGGITISVSCDREQQQLSVAITDTGIGLTPEQMNKLFTAFGQADITTTRHYGGTGLGLYLSQQLAQRLGGAISVASQYGVGSTFTLSIATGSLTNVEWLAGDLAHEVKRLPDTIPRLTGQVLYAEDNEDNQLLIRDLVQLTGASITAVGNGKKALEYCERNPVDLVLTDVRMPILDGIELTKILLSKNSALPVVAITATLLDEEITELKAIGFKEVLRKPVSRQALYAALNQFLRRRSERE